MSEEVFDLVKAVYFTDDMLPLHRNGRNLRLRRSKNCFNTLVISKYKTFFAV